MARDLGSKVIVLAKISMICEGTCLNIYSNPFTCLTYKFLMYCLAFSSDKNYIYFALGLPKVDNIIAN